MTTVQHGYLALIDVLGFSDLVRGDHDGNKIRGYLDYLGQLTTARGVEAVAFSDSIILTAKGDGQVAFLKIGAACSALVYELLIRRIPIRGAIAYGRYVREAPVGAESVFVGGEAVLDAYRYEKSQNWVGIMIAPSALEQLDAYGDLLRDRCRLPIMGSSITKGDAKDVEARIAWASIVQECNGIPFHRENAGDPTSFDGMAIVPTAGDLNFHSVRDSIKTSIHHLEVLRSLAPSPRAQQKYTRTLTWLKEQSQVWNRLEEITNSAQ